MDKKEVEEIVERKMDSLVEGLSAPKWGPEFNTRTGKLV